jgi:hypothetical protein
MRAEKKSRWRADVATPFAPHTLSEGVFPLRCLAIAFGAKQVRTRELKEPGEFTCSQRGFYIVIPKGELVVQSELFQGAHIKDKQHRSYGSNFKLDR